MAKVQLSSNNDEPVNLAPGVVATLIFPIDPVQQSIAPQQIPIWHFDETSATWKEEGIASRTGNDYVFTVNHFSWWNCDQPERIAYIKGKVVDCSGAPVSNVVVNINSMTTTTTDNLGNYQTIVLANTSFPVQVLGAQNNGIFLNSQIEIVPAIPAQQYYTVPDLVIPCPAKISGTISDCNGTPGTGTVVATWNGGQHFIYCDNGSFVIDVPPSLPVVLRFYNNQTMLTQAVNTGSSGTTINSGNTILCGSSTSISTNSFFINGGRFVHELINIDTIIARANEPNGFWVDIYGMHLHSGMPVSLSIALDDTLNQNYPINNITSASYFTISGLGINEEITPVNQGNVTLMQWSPRAKGTFYGVFYGMNGTIYTVYNGKFDVPTYY